MGTAIICVAILALLVVGIKTSLKRIHSGCCGGGDAPKKWKVADKTRAHYPYAVRMEIEGMSCRNCAVRVENALNKLGNVWAKDNLEKKEATVLLKENVDDEKLSAAVGAAGYSAGRIAHIRP